MKTILAPIDFSPHSRRVVAAALKLARAVNGSVILMHSVPPPPVPVTDFAPMGGRAFYVWGDMEKRAKQHLRRLQRELEHRGHIVETVCTSGFPIPYIQIQARKRKADYIVMGSRGHSRLRDLVMGSTTSGVLKRATCPVVVVPPPARKRKPRQLQFVPSHFALEPTR